MAGKIALVTGAAAGLGRAIALRLAEEGATLVLADIDAAGLAETERQIKAHGWPVMAVAADVTEEAPVKALFAAALAAYGRLDILVNDVGGGTSGRIWEAKVEDWDLMIRLNLRSAFLCTREAAAHMRERRAGRIVNLQSGAREGTPWTAYYIGNSAYSAAKAGIHGFTRSVALELAEYGVTVNAVAPGRSRPRRTGPGFRADRASGIRADPRHAAAPHRHAGRHGGRGALSCLGRGQLHHRRDARRRRRSLSHGYIDRTRRRARSRHRGAAGPGRRTTRRAISVIENCTWPDGARIAVNFTADFDAMLLRRVLNEPPQQLAKGEFGGRVGIWRLIELFDSHGIKATIFTPGRICELYPQAVKAAARARPRDRRPHVGAPGSEGSRARARPSAQGVRGDREADRPPAGRHAQLAHARAPARGGLHLQLATTRSIIGRTT